MLDTQLHGDPDDELEELLEELDELTTLDDDVEDALLDDAAADEVWAAEEVELLAAALEVVADVTAALLELTPPAELPVPAVPAAADDVATAALELEVEAADELVLPEIDVLVADAVAEDDVALVEVGPPDDADVVLLEDVELTAGLPGVGVHAPSWHSVPSGQSCAVEHWARHTLATHT